jgi:hypothetical protein
LALIFCGLLVIVDNNSISKPDFALEHQMWRREIKVSLCITGEYGFKAQWPVLDQG